MRPLSAALVVRVLRRDQRGSSSPVVVETGDGPWLLKLRGAAQGTGALVAEVIVGGIADRIGLPVPERRVLRLGPETPTDDRNDELADLLAASHGENLGFRLIARARAPRAEEIARVGADLASQVRWLDWLVMNPDRTPDNPNLLVDGQRWWLIDHGACLGFQHNWAAVTEQAPLRPPPATPHVFDGLATCLAVWDPVLTELLPRAQLEAIVAQVPDSFLAPLVVSMPAPDSLLRRRAAYVAFLWKRLQGPRVSWRD